MTKDYVPFQVSARPIHYLGSKLRLLDAIKSELDVVDPSLGTVCDLFSGSGTVSNYLLNFRNVVSVDIQYYSTVIANALSTHINFTINVENEINAIQSSPVNLFLQEAFKEIISYEEFCMKEAACFSKIENLYDIIENGSFYIFSHKREQLSTSPRLQEILERTLSALKAINMQESVQSMITRYYGGLYFSYAQATMMDAILEYAFNQEEPLKSKALAALLSTASEIVNTVGKQFAQPLKVRDTKGNYKRSLLKKILSDRSENVFEVYKKWYIHYLNVSPPLHTLKTLCMDYEEALAALKEENISAIYADPPYTRYHYSRYYHVLETICLRDNPSVSTTFPNGKGGISRAIYREGRHQSPFCIKSKAEDAFINLFKMISELHVPLVLSYSPYPEGKPVTPRLQTIHQLCSLATEYFNSVSVFNPGLFAHSKLNRTDKNFDSNHEAELLIICR